MNFGTHSTIEFLAMRLLNRWVPKWYEGFCDPQTDGFYERLGEHFKPVLTGSRRLLTQCRQLAIYSHASAAGCVIPGLDLTKHFDQIIRNYYVPKTGGWIFSVDDNAQPNDTSYDLYALSFVIFSFSHYFRATGDARAQIHALETLQFIDTHFRMSGRDGFAEARDADLKIVPKIRRQNPHMHLLEACLFAEETWGGGAYRAVADEMVALFDRFFYAPEENRLSEFFTDDLTPHPETGAHVEPGHYFEWIWLLKKYGTMHDDICLRLLNWANANGWDNHFGGIYDAIDLSNAKLTDTKRLWPFTEAIKANALMLDAVAVADKVALKVRMTEMIAVFNARYMQERGFWVEWLSRDFKPQSDYMPGTTPYHVYFGIMETQRIIQARGKSVSLGAWPIRLYYRIRRAVSAQIRAVRLAIIAKRA